MRGVPVVTLTGGAGTNITAIDAVNDSIHGCSITVTTNAQAQFGVTAGVLTANAEL